MELPNEFSFKINSKYFNKFYKIYLKTPFFFSKQSLNKSILFFKILCVSSQQQKIKINKQFYPRLGSIKKFFCRLSPRLHLITNSPQISRSILPTTHDTARAWQRSGVATTGPIARPNPPGMDTKSKREISKKKVSLSYRPDYHHPPSPSPPHGPFGDAPGQSQGLSSFPDQNEMILGGWWQEWFYYDKIEK